MPVGAYGGERVNLPRTRSASGVYVIGAGVHLYIYIYTVGVNIKFPYRTVYRPYRTFKKRLARQYRFILLGVTQYYCYTRSEYRAESSFKWIFLLCLYRCCFLLGRSAPVYRLFLLFSSINRFSSGQVRSSSLTELFLLL